MQMLAPVLEQEGLTLYDMEVTVRPRNSLLRVYIDRPGGVNVTHCESVSHTLSAMLDVDDPFPGSYTLEVSSPGLTRRLTKEEHFVKSAGSWAKVAFKKGFTGGPLETAGLIESPGGGKFRLVPEKGAAVEFEFKDVSRAKLDLKP
ncbi:MAG: ribosome maturation factor RimP [Nitrospinae bacterium]|nr:ribosome maturation factor RimP [Nitrospinota bacterium]